MTIIIINGGGPKNIPGKNSVSKQNLRYNAVRFKKELEMNVKRLKLKLNNTNKTITEMKVNILKMEERKRN